MLQFDKKKSKNKELLELGLEQKRIFFGKRNHQQIFECIALIARQGYSFVT